MRFDKLNAYIPGRMKMSHIYRPLLIREPPLRCAG